MSGNHFNSSRPEHLARVVSVENVREWREKADSTFETHNSQIQALIQKIKRAVPNGYDDETDKLDSQPLSSSQVQRVEMGDRPPQTTETKKPEIDRLEVLARRIEAQLSNSRETSDRHHQIPE